MEVKDTEFTGSEHVCEITAPNRAYKITANLLAGEIVGHEETCVITASMFLTNLELLPV